ncbi:aminotransferase class I/II-fold pyridoxal phosphate-dependent enzyme [Saccharopolyspora sp. K220]|uniref:aminotransferase class I/II-fold pyridoxal phosphate-dependent enzyme n=1 Tax=Saccharopolyspora soli TaxID=2926618 RepID=UPI001F58DAE5|nr:aminotransferase class I/II-fold pyridoxal phosphate-dependent enzyme [Saccharopolyspora soli]MCI2418416.1 aminotransferase class I/II-fold pyridoxal phosphate-dependent enzyme [Saccharopolyspora soli]
MALGTEDLSARLEQYRADYKRLLDEGLSLDLTRGKPSAAQLDLANPLLGLPGEDGFRTADGTDARNYGGLQGLPELRAIWGPLLGVPADQLITGGNSSLAVMHDCVVNALLNGTTDGPRWVDAPSVAFLCPVPGYDRHFGICERFGIEMIPVPLNDDGPDLATVRELAAGDARIKGMWCVPKYSNPTGISYSDEVVRGLASMPTAAPDFRLFWDNAYGLHHHGETRAEIADVLALATEAGSPDRPLLFASTSKITLAGSGVSFFGGSPANVEWLLAHLQKRTIGPDKVNELRHARFLPDADAVRAHMDEHAAILRPKFDAVHEILTERLGDSGVGSWTRPDGGYFISLDVLDGCASRVVALAKDAGVALTPAGATHPYGNDPADRTIRISPSFPPIDELTAATRALATCVLLAAAEKLTAR